MQKAWISAPYQKWPKKMPGSLPPPPQYGLETGVQHTISPAYEPALFAYNSLVRIPRRGCCTHKYVFIVRRNSLFYTLGSYLHN